MLDIYLSFSSLLCVMDSENSEATYGLQVALENGGHGRPSGGPDDINWTGSKTTATETAAPNGKIETVVNSDDGVSNYSSAGEVKEESSVNSASNGLTIAKVKSAGLWLVLFRLLVIV